MQYSSLWDIYDEIMKEARNWNYYSEMNPEQTSQDLFSGTNALDYIKSTFVIGGKAKVLEITYDHRFEMSQYRSNHTLSAYLLGIALRDKLHIDMRELPQIAGSPKKNFLYFWSLTSLYHDFAFSLEEASKTDDEYCAKLHTLEDFIRFFGIENSLLAYSKEASIISNYYRYIIEKFHKVDHGIAGAMLFCNAMLNEYHNAMAEMGITKKTPFVYHGKKYSKDFEKHIILIANTIAKHNMWRATPDNRDVYLDYGLDELIPGNVNYRKLSVNSKNQESSKEKLLFLLCLVDTLEPIKDLGRPENKHPLTNPYIILEKIRVDFDYRNGIIRISCPIKYMDDYWKNIDGIDSWMDVSCSKENEIIEITLTSNATESKKVA